jgi:deoxyribose-phosphate aldolase
MTPEELAGRLQHTNVKPDATRVDIERLLDECLEYRLDGAMVNPIWVPLARDVLSGAGVNVCTALDFPMGGGTTASVARAVAEARALGADQVDVMTKVGWLRSGMNREYRDHLAQIVDAADGSPVKAMLEAGQLTRQELALAVDLCVDAGISYVKNSSGYGGGDATPELISDLAVLAGGRVKVKASGGIRTAAQAEALIQAGADLLGSSASVAIVTGTAPAPTEQY